MTAYLRLLVSPSIYFDKVNTKKYKNVWTFIIWSLAFTSMELPKLFVNFQSLKLSIGFFALIYVFTLVIVYYLIAYGLSYLYWVVGKGLKGESKYIEIKDSFIYSLIPYIIYLPFSLTYCIMGFVKADNEMILHSNYITQLILSLLSFRIFIIGIAKYNKFTWIIALFNWFIVGITLIGLIYMIKH